MSVKTNNKPSNNHIEKDANGIITKKLRGLFLSKNFELGENKTDSSQDWGTDFYIEVFNKEKGNKREMLFLLQCKGISRKPKILKDENSFSFTMKLRHANYFFHELSEPLVFMVCDVTEVVYWYAVQLDAKLKNKIIEQASSKKKTLQVKIPAENILNEDNFEKFLEDLYESKKAQLHKKREHLNSKASYDAVNKSFERLNVVEGILKVLEMFEGINVFPTSMINKIKIFTGESGSLYSETLSTDSEIFYDFIDNIEIRDQLFYLKNDNVDYANLPDFQDKIRHILNFFKVNWITHIAWRGKSKKTSNRICVHNLFISKRCDCERCSYNRLNFPKVIELLNTEDESISSEYRLRRSYTYYLLSDFEKSFSELKKIISNVSVSKTPGIYIVAKYNLLQLKNLIKWGYFKDTRHEILRELEEETFALDEILLPNYFLDIFKRISENEFVNNAVWDIDSKLYEIQKNWRSDQFGGSSNNSHARNLIVEFLRAYNFVEYNHLIYNEYREFEVLVNKTLEGIFALYTINNPSSSKYAHFGYTIIDMWLFHAEPKHIKYLLSKYRLKSLNVEFSDIEFDRLNEYIINLINSAPIIIQNFKNENFTHNDKIKKIIQNFLLIIGVANLPNNEKNILLNRYLLLIETINEWHFTSFEYLEVFLNYESDVNLENLEKIISILISHDHYNHDVFTTTIDIYTQKFEDTLQLETSLKKLLKIEKFIANDFCERNKFSDLIFIINRLTKATKESIKSAILTKLNEKFESNLFYTFSIYDVLDFDESLMKKYFDLTPDISTRQTGSELLTGRKELKNYHLDKGINLMFHFDKEFTTEIRALSSRAIDKEYYDWIMNIDDYDYSNFNSYWILHYQTESHFKAYRKSKKLKKEIINSLKKKYIEGVATILINKL